MAVKACAKQQFSVCERIKDGEYTELGTAGGKMGYKLNIRYLNSVADKEMF